MTDIDQISRRWLEHEDAVNRKERLERLKWLGNLTPSRDWVSYHGGVISEYLYDESRYCFVYGQFLATIILGLAFVDHSIGAILYGFGRNDLKRASVSSLLSEGFAAGLISHAEYAALQRIKKTRNPFVHFRPPDDPERVETRSVDADEHPYALIEEDARLVMIVVQRLLGPLPLV